MKLILLVWALCVLISHDQANMNFETPKPTPTDKYGDYIWYHIFVHTANMSPTLKPLDSLQLYIPRPPGWRWDVPASITC